MPPLANAGSNLQVDQLRKTNEQLKRELNVKRAKLSDSARAIISYCEGNQRNDGQILLNSFEKAQ